MRRRYLSVNQSNRILFLNCPIFGGAYKPVIKYFKSNKQTFENDEEVTLSWKTVNADNVMIIPFGTAPRIGQKTYRIKNFKNAVLTIVLVVENNDIGRQVKSTLTSTNKNLNKHFNENTHGMNQSVSKHNTSIKEIIMLFVVIFLVLILILFFLVNMRKTPHISDTLYGTKLKVKYLPKSKLAKFDIPCKQSVQCVATRMCLTQTEYDI